MIQSVAFPLSQGMMGRSSELHHLTGSPGGGGVVSRLCHTLIRVNTVRIKQTNKQNYTDGGVTFTCRIGKKFENLLLTNQNDDNERLDKPDK